MPTTHSLESTRIVVEDDEFLDFAETNGWTDGLPVVAPTYDRVNAMLSGTSRQPAEVLGLVPPAMGLLTVEKVAVNAVMAGCKPEHLPVVLAAVEATMAPELNIAGIQTTTHPVSPLIIVNGPIRQRIGINSGYNALGQGARANACIGRALRLVLMNTGNCRPGDADKATHGSPAKYSYCTGENEEESPWQSLRAERGFADSESTVTIVGAEAPHNINDHGSTDAMGMLTTIAGAMATTGSNNVYYDSEPLVVLSPEHAATIAGDGYTKDDAKRALFELSGIRLSRFSRSLVERHHVGRWTGFRREAAMSYLDGSGEDVTLPIAEKWEDIMLVVSGGPGRHSAFIPTYGATRAVTRPITP